MANTAEQLKTIFTELDLFITHVNQKRRLDGDFAITKGEVTLLGQMSLLSNKKVSSVLSLAQTADLDAALKLDHIVKVEFAKILFRHGLIYDEDSHLIWIPGDAKFESLFNFQNLIVKVIDPESALLSKAVKASAKNKILIREAINSKKFPTLVERILKSGGALEDFL